MRRLDQISRSEGSAEWFIWAFPLLWRRRSVLLKAGAVGLLCFAVAAFLIPNEYQSTVRLMPPDQESKLGFASLATALGGIPPSVASGGLAGLVNSRSPNAVFLAILQSRTAQDDIVNKFDLRKIYGYSTYLKARKKLSRRTDVDEDKKTGVVTITVTDHDPTRARDIASAYIEELNKLVVSMDTSSAHRERIFLEQRIAEVKKNLDAASEDLSRFSSSHATMDVQHQATVTLDATARLQGELIAAQSQLSGLQAIYSTENVRVRSAEARVDSLKEELRKLGGYHSSTGDLTSDQPYPSLRELPLLGVKYSELYRRVAVDETVFETLSKQYELAKVEEAKEIPSVSVLDAPNIPEKKSSPPRVMIILGGTLLVLLGNAAWLLCTDHWRQTDNSDPRKSAILRMLAGLREATAPSESQELLK